MKVLIYGVGLAGRQVYKEMKNKVQVIGFLDSDPDKKGRVITDGLLCLGGPDCLSEVDFDQIQITSLFFREIKKSIAGVSDSGRKNHSESTGRTHLGDS